MFNPRCVIHAGSSRYEVFGLHTQLQLRAYLGRTIASIQQQSLADSEVLVSDNASTDGSVELVP